MLASELPAFKDTFELLELKYKKQINFLNKTS